MDIDNKIKISRNELMAKERVVVERICNDDKFAYYFFHDKCRPLLSKILWTIFGNNSDYDELVNELYLLLRKPNAEGDFWHALKLLIIERHCLIGLRRLPLGISTNQANKLALFLHILLVPIFWKV